MLVQRYVDGLRAHRAHQHGVAVRGCFGDDLRADVATRAAAIVHHDGLP